MWQKQSIVFSMRMFLLYCSQPGNTMAEYAILIGLIAVASIAGLTLFGTSTSNLLAGAGQNNDALEMTRMNFSGSSGSGLAVSRPSSGVAGGTYQPGTNPQTGLMDMQVFRGIESRGTNVTSIEGDRRNSSGSLTLALSLEALAKEALTPEEANYYMALAKKAYMIGFVEATIDENNSPVGLSDQYSRETAFLDLAIYKAQLVEVMRNRPANIMMSKLGEAMALASEVENIGQEYINMIDQYKRQGQLSPNFYLNLEAAHGQIAPQWEKQDSAVSLSDMPEVRDTAANIAGNNQTSSLKSQITLNDASQLDAMGQISP
jgi:Flp pilus assembly pilin Flp